MPVTELQADLCWGLCFYRIVSVEIDGEGCVRVCVHTTKEMDGAESVNTFWHKISPKFERQKGREREKKKMA